METEKQEGAGASEPATFPEQLDCPRCRRPWRVTALKSRTDVLLTKVKLTCPNCQKPLREMRLKDWYDHYVHVGG